MSTLDEILEARRAAVARNSRDRPWASLERPWKLPVPAFDKASPFTLIAECKCASPSRGILVEDYDPARLALAYERGGASVVSVLTEPSRFFGHDSHLEAVRAAVGLPILRKDFIFDPYQVREAWAIGADAVLLIAACLDPRLVEDLADAAHEHGLEVLLEIHGRDELEGIDSSLAEAIGVNARNLRDLSLDPGMVSSIAGLLPKEALRVAESGLKNPATAQALYRLGYRGFLVGEHFATAAEPEASVLSFATALSDCASRRGGPR